MNNAMNKKSKKPAQALLERRTDVPPDSEMKKVEAYARDYLAFLGTAKTERLAYAEAVKLLEAKGFRPLDEFKALKPGDKVWRGYHGKTLMAAVVGRKGTKAGLRIVGGHTDAPRIDLKSVPLAEKGGLAFFDTHYYGGIKKFQWVTIPLALYGVVVRKDGTKAEIAVGDKPGDPVFLISDILPHLGQDQMSKPMRDAIPGENLDPIVGSLPEPGAKKGAKDAVKKNVLRLLLERYGVTEQDLASAELEVVPAGAPRELGFDRGLLVGYGHDDRVCAYAALRALLDRPAAAPEHTAMVLLCDKEEIGSVGATGMESTFFENSVAELLEREEREPRDIVVRRALEASQMLSADVTSAADPHFPDVDSPGNSAVLHAGPCFNKYTGSRGKSGANDARAEFLGGLRATLDGAGVRWQIGELGKVDKGGGGTIAMFLSRYGMDVVDLGTPLLNMHAPWEVASKIDCWYTHRAYAAFLA